MCNFTGIMAKVLIVSATVFEIKDALEQFIKISSPSNYSYTYQGHTIDVLVTGVGMVNTAYALGKTNLKDYDLVINAGIAGSFNKKLELGTVVNVIEDTFSELGAEDGDEFLPIDKLELGNLVVKNNNAWQHASLNSLPHVTGITVNTVHGNEASIEKIRLRLPMVEVESMEGAAFLQACNREEVSCIQLRSISNYVERRNKAAWNMPLAIQHLNAKLLELLNCLNE